MRFLVIGVGSIGERHICNLMALKAGEIIVHDTDSQRLSLIGSRYKVTTYYNLEEAMEQKVDACIVCVPPTFHVPVALRGIQNGAHLFIEKPISHNLDAVDVISERARTKGLIVAVGYNLRFHPGLKIVKQMLSDGKIGRVLSARVEAGQYLPDWRPWQNYKQSYTARKEMGGGIILDGSHELDYIRWLVGEIKNVCCLASKVSNLEVNVEDIAEILLEFSNGAIANVHLDFIQRVYARSCKLIGENGTIIWDYSENRVKLFSAESNQWQEIKFDFEPNDMYLDEMKHFIRCIKGEETPMIGVETAKRVLEIALAAKKSAEQGLKVKV